MPSCAILSGIIVRLRNLTDIKCMPDPVFPAVDIYRLKFQPDCLRTTTDCSLTLGLRNVYQRFHQSTFSFSWVKMGACVTKISSRRREKRKSFRETLFAGQKKKADKYEGTDSRDNEEGETSGQNSGKRSAKTTLRELQLNPPPGFRKFESEVDWQTMDEEIALQLWVDVFKPLYTFCIRS